MANKTKETKMSKSNKQSKILEAVVVEETPVVVQRVRPSVDEKGRYKVVDMSMEELSERKLTTKSSVIRFLVSENFSPSAVAKFLNIRYQHVRNVMNQELKRPAANAAVAPVEPTEESEVG